MNGSTNTSWPSGRLVVSGPIAATRPTHLEPGIIGVGNLRNGTAPDMTSLRFPGTILVRTRTTTLPGIASGVGMDSNLRGWPTSWQIRALQVEGKVSDMAKTLMDVNGVVDSACWHRLLRLEHCRRGYICSDSSEFGHRAAELERNLSRSGPVARSTEIRYIHLV